MKKRKFYDWEVLPLDTTKEIGKRLDDELKKRLHEHVDEMFLQSWHPAYIHANTTLLEWMAALTDGATMEFEIDNGTPTIICNLIPEDWDQNFCIKIPIVNAASKTAEWLRYEYSEDERKTLADALRAAADALYD